MKALLIAIILVAAMVLLGWMSFSGSGGSASVTVDTNKVKQDTAAAVEKTKEVAREGADALKDVADGPDDDEPHPAGADLNR